MSAPTPYQAALNTSQSLGNAFGQARDTNALDEIFTQIKKAGGKEEDYDNAMRSILKNVSPERQATAYQILQDKIKQNDTNSFLKSLRPQQNMADNATDKKYQANSVQGTNDNMNTSQNSAAMNTANGELNITPEHLIKANAINPTLANTLSKVDQRQQAERHHNESLEFKKAQAERGYHSEYAKKAVEKVDGLRESIPKKETALSLARDAIEQGNLGYFSKDKLADITGISAFRTAKGAQLLTAAKENLLSNMSRVSARAQNQWFEQRLASMFPQIGNTDEANLSIQEMIEGEVAMDNAYLKEFDRIAAEDNQKYGYERKDIEKRARDASKFAEKEIFDRTTYRLKELQEKT